MHEVKTPTNDPRALGRFVASDRLDQLLGRAERLRTVLDGAAVISISSTASGGGVAEMLQMLLPYVRGAGIDARWLVIEGDEAFFALTKRLHNHLYGTAGDGGPLGDDEHRHYAEVLHRNAVELAVAIRPGDVVVLHDPQPGGLADALRHRGARVVWRCHVGTDRPNEYSETGWDFLHRYLAPPNAEAYVFSRAAFAPPWIPGELVREIAPSIDPLSAKNRELSPEQTEAILVSVGLLSGRQTPPDYEGTDGTTRRIEHGADIIRTGPPPAADVPLVVQVSRWDRLKDMAGVMHGFADSVARDHGAHLVLAGPVVTSIADDPEQAEVLMECFDAWRSLPHHARQRIALACIPTADLEENAIIVNALQRHASIVVQKSLAEGFGLTVSEAMFKTRPVIGSAVGGIVDQIVDGETGLLLADPNDRHGLTSALQLLGQPERLATMGERARQRVIDRFLPDSQLARWTDLLLGLLDRSRDG